MPTIVVTLPADNTTADVGDYNVVIQAMLAIINGYLDDSNIASLSGTKITAGTIPSTAFSATANQGWITNSTSLSAITCLGNRSYSMATSTDQSGVLSPGMRVRFARSVAAPTKCTTLNGSTQYYSNTGNAGMTFTDDFVVGAWIKLTSYTNAGIVSRFNGTSGWILSLNASGQPTLYGANAGGANFSQVVAYQSVPLNKWVHITAQLDMSSFTATPTTSYIMIDGVDVPASVGRGGTNPTALIQAGNLEIGSYNAGTNFFPGKIAQAFVTSAKVTQATIRSNYISQSISPTETSLISAYSFNNSINDLNTSNANNLTANGSAVATNADSPFTLDASNAPGGTYDYGILTGVSSSSLTVQVPEGCAIPTSGGISAFSYSGIGVPFGFPKQKGRWLVGVYWPSGTLLSLSDNTWNSGRTANGLLTLSIPAGEWDAILMAYHYSDVASTTNIAHGWSISTSSSSPNADKRFVGEAMSGNGSTTTVHESANYLRGLVSVSTQTPYYAVFLATHAGNHQLNVIPLGMSYLEVENAYL